MDNKSLKHSCHIIFILLVICAFSYQAQAIEGENLLMTGYHKEDPTNNPEDPTTGFIYIRLPVKSGPFVGQFLFSYVGCEGNMNTGKVKGMKSNQVMSGSWSGTVDGVAIGGSFQGKSSGESQYQGAWSNKEGKVPVSKGSGANKCAYHVAAKGTWQIKGKQKEINKIKATNQGRSLHFAWPSSNQGNHNQLFIYDAECLKNKLDIATCLRWYNVTPFSNAVYGQGMYPAKPLQSGRSYRATVISNDDQNRLKLLDTTTFIAQ